MECYIMRLVWISVHLMSADPGTMHDKLLKTGNKVEKETS